MAIQIRRGSNAEWESTNGANIVVGEPVVTLDSGRLFIGTGTGTYTEFANISALASEYDPSKTYYEWDFVTHDGKLYVCDEESTGTWNAAKWVAVNLNDIIGLITAQFGV